MGKVGLADRHAENPCERSEPHDRGASLSGGAVPAQEGRCGALGVIPVTWIRDPLPAVVGARQDPLVTKISEKKAKRSQPW
jgi:hypothetical protein